jgi:hypothetical protein
VTITPVTIPTPATRQATTTSPWLILRPYAGQPTTPVTPTTPVAPTTLVTSTARRGTGATRWVWHRTCWSAYGATPIGLWSQVGGADVRFQWSFRGQWGFRGEWCR